MGQFTCRNDNCGTGGWSSRMVAITIRQYPGRNYNARVYHQRCQGCSPLSRPFLDGSYAERIAYRLKKWSGIEVETPFYSDESKGPHQSSLCKAGHCSQIKKEDRFL
ncbi:hypothetical protein TOPH_06227 [Tolypocladium ophioglossoides CBS 100239]|uniref:3CxxC-type domain-containing protein n=1 Tax=Tolypocladium ophioglossoides (strain CBS 100239) TaxID=1163406 RepID=A0A0L0N549_TOLOC|nr:hypothetical protein TOPH_06227 [Tolypocladium ophioglossoides CBS 100239]